MLLKDGKVPLRWWVIAPNFGDLLSPWLVSKISGREVVFASKAEPHYLAIGSVLKRARQASIVWGSGSFGTEIPSRLSKLADYRAVRGPLTRNKLSMARVSCPRVYGDPALLVPDYYPRNTDASHEVGVILRWSEHKWRKNFSIPGVKLINFGTDQIESTLDEILSCRRIFSSSLHGLIVADAYGIPNAWLHSRSPKGGEFKFWDYMISVGKLRQPLDYDVLAPDMTLDRMLADIEFDGRPIQLDLDPLRKSCPFA